MHIFITGGTGFIGQHLVKTLLERDEQVTLLVRDRKKAERLFSEAKHTVGLVDSFEGNVAVDGIINLAGEPIIDHRWTESRKEILYKSRVKLTKRLVEAISQSAKKPQFLISGSAVGYYGNYPEAIDINEGTAPRACFASDLCKAWEKAAFAAEEVTQQTTRVCCIRTGIVLDKNYGALKKMWLPFCLGLGGKVGNGKQWFPWIHIEDMIKLLLFLIDNSQLQGVFNATAPKPINNETFTKQLAKALHRPAFLPVPKALLKIAMGESSQLLLEGQRAVPQKLLDHGFNFDFETIEQALGREVSK